MRYIVLFFFLLESLISFAQSFQSKSINNGEKQRLEDEFKVLGDYYIDDSGLVVYRANSMVEIKNNQGSSRPNNNNVSSMSRPPLTTTISAVEVEPKANKAQSNDIQKSNKKYYPSSNTSNTSSVYLKSNQNIKNTPPIAIDKSESGSYKETLLNETNSSTTDMKKQMPTENTGSILNRTRKSQYKDMEEAALAIEALIADLKKEQTIYTNSGSMSSRLSRGVTKDLRKKSEDNIQQISSQNNSLNEVDNLEEVTSFNNEPSYFINGVQVDKTEINKLNKSDILNREIRIRNTVTGNPNGEIWYEVKVQ